MKKAVKNETKKHALLSASGSARWINCAGSVEAEKPYPESTSIYADEGTLAHELADRCLKKGKDASFYIGKRIAGQNISEDMARYVQEYLDYVLSHETKDSILFTEDEVDFSNVVPEGFGTLDSAILIPKERICHIFDLKYGAGVLVEAFENTQGQLYAIGILNELGWLGDVDKFRIHIVQPRKENFSYWDISVKDLQSFGKFVTERAALALMPGAARTPGEKQCEWCKAKADCKALAKFTEDLISASFDEIDDSTFKTKQDLTDQEKKLILDNQKLITDFFHAIETDVFTRLSEGEEFKGYKLVHGKSSRIFNSKAEDVLVKKLGEAAYKKSLIGITEAEKKLGKKVMEKITTKPEGKLTMVKDTDSRKAVVPTKIIDQFDEEDDL